MYNQSSAASTRQGTYPNPKPNPPIVYRGVHDQYFGKVSASIESYQKRDLNGPNRPTAFESANDDW
eukprot:gene11423-3410_t